MKNTENYSLKKAIFMSNEDFENLIEKVTGESPFIEYSLDGVSYSTENYNEEDIRNKLSVYFDVEVTSIHIDDCDFIGVWIVYKE